MNRINRFFSLTILLFISLYPQLAVAETVDRIIAVVNDEIITLSELNKHAQPYFYSLMQQSSGSVSEARLAATRNEILDRLIDRILLTQKADKLGIRIGEKEVESAIESILVRNKVGREQFVKEIAAMGSSEELYREEIREQMLKSRLVNAQVRSKIVISDEKIADYYQNKFAQADQGPDGYHILQIGIKSGDNPASRLTAIQSIEGLRNQVLQGENFQSLAREFSELPSAEDGGDIGVFKPEEMASYMKKALVTLQPGKCSDIIETPTSLQFFKVLSIREQGKIVQAPLESVRDEIKDILYRQEMERYYEKWTTELRSQAFIKENL